MMRGINKGDIFIDDEDRRKFLGRLGEIVQADTFSLYAWVLMSNHVHLLLRSGGRRRKVTQARGAIAYRATTELGLSGADIARCLGVTTSSITRAVERTEKQQDW